MHIKHSRIREFYPVLICLGTLIGSLGACSKRAVPPNSTEFRQQPQDYSFKVSGVLAEASLTLRLNRTLEVGPALNGQIHKSRLTERDAGRLQRDWSEFKKTAFSGPESCQDWPQESQWRDATMKIEVLENGRTVLALQSEAGKLCGRGELQAARVFSETVLGLTRSHYPKSFPSECLALQDELESEFEQVRSCTSDAECTHVDPQYEAVPVGQIQYIALKSCSAVPPLPTANAQSLAESRRKLLRLRESIRQVCQPQGIPVGCSTADELGFQNHRHPAQCLSGSCSSGVE
jgi:hypothetical protein